MEDITANSFCPILYRPSGVKLPTRPDTEAQMNSLHLGSEEPTQSAYEVVFMTNVCVVG